MSGSACLPVRMVAGLILLVCLPRWANAGFTPVYPVSTEVIKKALDTVYFGGANVFLPNTPSAQGQPIYTGGGITARRVDDFGVGGTLNIGTGSPGSADDQTWSGGPFTATVKYRVAGYHSMLFYAPAPGTEPVPLLPDGIGSTATVTNPPAQWIWGLGVSSSGTSPFWRTRWSEADLNEEPNGVNGLDYMITYRVDGLPDGKSRWLLFWGDGAFPLYSGGQWYSSVDYDDLVVEITPIPEPGGVQMLVAGGLWLLRRRCRSGFSSPALAPDRS